MLGSDAVPAAPAVAADVLGPALPAMERYAELLATVGRERGLIGPREADRVWDRHILNCAAVAGLLRGPLVVDLGSGAGLPGIVLAAGRPDLTFLLVDATRRRVQFCDEVIEGLGLANVSTRWARAEDMSGTVTADEVVARAVAPLDRLVGWALPLLRPGGRLLAMKGEGAADEAAAAATAIRRSGGSLAPLRVVTTAAGDPVRVVEVTRRAAGR